MSATCPRGERAGASEPPSPVTGVNSATNIARAKTRFITAPHPRLHRGNFQPRWASIFLCRCLQCASCSRDMASLAKLVVVLSTMLILGNSALAQTSERSNQTTSEVTRIAHAVRVDKAPKLDGTLDDSIWQLASP